MKTKTRIPRWLLLICLGTLSGVFILAAESTNELRLLCLIPFVYSFMTFICIHVSSEVAMNNISGIIFNGVMFLRAVVMPLLMVASGSRIRNSTHMEAAILLFAYEIIVEFLIVGLFFWKNKPRDEAERIDFAYDSNKYGKVVLFFLIGAAFCLILSPMAIGYYRTIFGLTDFEYTGFDSRSITQLYATSFLRKLGLVTFRYLMNVIRVIIPSIIVLKAHKRKMSNASQIALALISVFVFNFLIVDDTIATSLFNALIVSIFYRIIHGKSTKGIIRYSAITFAGVLVYFFIRFSFSTSASSPVYRVSSTAQAYFGGLENISAGLEMSEANFEMRFKYGLYEILRGIPYASTIFGLDNTNISSLFNRAGGTTGQIIPTICSSRLYFGYILSPLYTILFLSISLLESKRVETETKPLRLLSSIIICVYSLMGISVYSPEITWTAIICVGLVTRLISTLFEKKRVG